MRFFFKTLLKTITTRHIVCYSLLFLPHAICSGIVRLGLRIAKLIGLSGFSLGKGNVVTFYRVARTCGDVPSVMSCLRRMTLGYAAGVIFSDHRKITCDYHKDQNCDMV